jgi:hypothetical protein
MTGPRVTTTATVNLPAAIDNARRYAGDAARRVKELEAKNARLREALDFYGDVSKYLAPFTGGMGALWQDCGQIARAALGEKE